MFSSEKMRALELVHGQDFAAKLQGQSAKDATELDEQNVIRKSSEATPDTPVTPAATPDPITPGASKEDIVAAVPEEFEAQVIQGFELLTTQLTALTETLTTVNGRLDEVEKSVVQTQQQQGSSKASLNAWLQGKTTSATLTPNSEIGDTDPFAGLKPVDITPSNGHLLGGL